MKHRQVKHYDNMSHCQASSQFSMVSSRVASWPPPCSPSAWAWCSMRQRGPVRWHIYTSTFKQTAVCSTVSISSHYHWGTHHCLHFIPGIKKQDCVSNESSRGQAVGTQSPLASGAVVMGWPRHKDGRQYVYMPEAVFFSELQEGKRNCGAPQESATLTKTSLRDTLHKQESTISCGSRMPQTKIAGAHQWERPVISSRQRGMKLQRKDTGGRKRGSLLIVFSPSSHLSNVQ